MQAVKGLPENYHQSGVLKLSGAKAGLWLNLAAVPLLFLFGWIFSWLINNLRGNSPLPTGIPGYFTLFSGTRLVVLLVSILLMLVLHELIHGLFFWIFTHEQPKFSLKSGYAFAAAPDWLVPSRQYIIIGLSPLIVISVLCIFLALFIFQAVIPYLLLVATFNAAGALGDMIVVTWVISQPKAILVKDEGDIFYAFMPDKV